MTTAVCNNSSNAGNNNSSKNSYNSSSNSNNISNSNTSSNNSSYYKYRVSRVCAFVCGLSPFLPKAPQLVSRTAPCNSQRTAICTTNTGCTANSDSHYNHDTDNNTSNCYLINKHYNKTSSNVLLLLIISTYGYY